MKGLRHEPLRVPEKWQGQDRALVIQIERILDDIYAKLGQQIEMKEAISDLADRVAELEE